MKQLSLILLLTASCSSFAMQAPTPASDEEDRSEEYDLKVETTEPSPHSVKRKTHSDSCHVLPNKKQKKYKQPITLLALVAREPGEPRPPSGIFRHFKLRQQ